MIVGHHEALQRVPSPLPPVTLLLGPDGIGKSLVAKHLARTAGATRTDLQVLTSFRTSDAHAMLQHHEVYPLSSPTKVTVADITRASDKALNAVLKILEEPPEYSRFVLYSSKVPLLTVMSRSMLVRLSPLHEDEVARVLQDQHGYNEEDAYELAESANGSVGEALRRGEMGDAYASLQSVTACLQQGDPHALNHAISAAMKPRKGDHATVTERKRQDRCTVLAEAVQGSLLGTSRQPVLEKVTAPARLRCLEVLHSRARAVLRYRQSVWSLAAGVGK